MKKRAWMLAAGMAVSFGVLTGCSSAPQETQPAETETEAMTEEETEIEEILETDTEAEDQEDADAAEDLADAAPIWGTIVEIGEGELTVDNQSPNSSTGEMILMIDPDQTKILDAVDGLPVALTEITGDTFAAYLEPAMTMSLPPQVTAELIFVNIPEDEQAPIYVTAGGAVEETDLGMTLTTQGGTDYVLTEETQILPYLTKNIVKAEDITEGSDCLIWQAEDGTVEKVVLFTEE